jgi:hypothetical protein
LERLSDDRVVSSHDGQGAGVPEPLGEGRGALDIGEEDGSESGRNPRLAHPWLPQPAEELDDRTPVDLDDLVRDESVRLTMNGLGGVRGWRIGQAEDRARLRIEPIRDVSHPVLLLDLQVSNVSLRDILRGGFGEIVSIHVQGHPSLRLNVASVLCRRTPWQARLAVCG